MLLFKDSIRLFAAYNEGIINLLGEARSLDSSLLAQFCVLFRRSELINN